MIMTSNVFVSEAIATRLSHDLIGNIGAVANAVELMNEDGGADEDIVHILNFSSAVLSHRLKFFRLCFGLSNATVKTTEEMVKLTEDYLSSLGNPNYQIKLKLAISTPKIYKLVMPSVMLMADAVIKNGTVAVTQTETNLQIKVSSDTPLNQTKLTNIAKILGGNEPDENPSSYAPLYYLMSYLEGSGVSLKFSDNTLFIGD